MKTEKKVLWKSPCLRWFSTVLACLMLLTAAAPVSVLAYGSEVPGVTESPAEAVPGDQAAVPAPGEPGGDPEVPEQPEAPAEPDTPPREDPQAPGGDETPGGEGQDPDAPNPDAPLPAGPDAPDAGPADPEAPDTAPEAPGTQPPEEAWSCPHGGGDSCALCVTGWTWIEDANLEGAIVWMEDEEPEEAPDGEAAPSPEGGEAPGGEPDPEKAKGGRWVLGLPGLGEEPLTWELLLTLLPQAVEVTTASGETRTVPLVWDRDANLQGAMSPEGVTVTAALDAAGYALTPAAPKLEVLVAAGGGEGLDAPALVEGRKFLNDWYFINKVEKDKYGNLTREIDILKDPATIIIAIEDLPSKSNAELEKWIRDTGLLPTRIGGWIPGASPDGSATQLGFLHNKEKNDALYETKATGKVLYYSKPDVPGVGIWGNFPIDEWDFSKVSSAPHNDGEIVQIFARNNVHRINGKDYRLYINSNHPSDHADSKGNTNVNSDIVVLNVKLVDAHLDQHTLGEKDIAKPENVTVNLFDYWVHETRGENPKAPDGDILEKSDRHYHEDNDGNIVVDTYDKNIKVATTYSNKDNWNLGINQGHLLLFGDGLIHAGLWNKGAGENCRYGKEYAGMEGIVKNTLDGNGYPEIDLPMANKVLTDGNPERDHKLIKDYKLAGDHTVDTEYESGNIKNISDTAIGLWETATSQTIGDQNAKESLNYLFDPTVSNTYKKSYTDVKGLFQISDDGYYYYNMRENFAEFAEGAQTDPEQSGYDPNRFILYDAGATTRTDAEQSIGNFFPFNKGSEVFNGLDNNGKLTSSVSCSNNSMNHHLGMTVDIDFRQPAGGRINTGSGGSGTPMTFGFSGDDDVWIFIDDVLVLDLGGVHSEIYGTIDFSDGDIYIGQAFSSKGIPDDPADPTAQGGKMVTHTTLREVYEKANKADSTQWHEKTFASNTSHKLKMFYLERGNYDSSIALRFNLQPLLHQRVVKVNQNGQPLPGVTFELYEAEEVPKGTAGAIQCLYTDRDVSTNTQDAGTDLKNKTFYVKKKSGADLLVKLTTGDDGSAVFMKDGQYFNFADRGDQYYILEETQQPTGYRKQLVDIVLGYDSSTSMLSVANRWTTGAYACSVSNVTAATSLNYGKVVDGTVIPDETKPVSADDQKNGLVVAIPMMKKRSDNSWMALYGSNLDSFQPVLPEGTGENAWKKAAAIAILNQAQKKNTADWHLDWDEDNHRLSGALFDLPGLANRYLLNDPKDGDLQMIYGFLDPTALATLGITGADAKARYTALREKVKNIGVEATYDLLLLDDFKFLSVRQFNRDFRSLIYIPNERRELRVLKIDQDGTPLADTGFTLYDAQGNFAASGTTDDNGMLIFSPAGDGSRGKAHMAWANDAEGTRYSLEETTPPAGYGRNPTRIPIVVGNYSIYADAGIPDDGITVMAGAGTLTQTMHQYAASQKVDVTLQDIAVVMQVQESGSFSLTGWRDAKLAGTDALRTMNLHYKKNNPEGQDYGLHDEDGGRTFAPYFVTDTGYVRTRIRQNWDALTGKAGYDAADPDANKEDLGDTDLTNLFSMVNMVVVGDRTDSDITTGSLTVSKTLTGPGLGEEDYTRLFRFRIRLTDAAGTPLGETFEYRFYGDDKTGRIKNGGELLLHHDEAVTILGLPQGTKYTVTEAPVEGWFTDPKESVLSGTIPVDPDKKDVTEAAAHFTNSKKPAPPPSSSTTPPGDDDDDDDDDPSSSGSSGTSASGGSGQPPRKSPATGDETETGHWAFLSVLFLAGAAAICLARFRRKEDPGAEDDRE